MKKVVKKPGALGFLGHLSIITALDKATKGKTSKSRH